MDGVENMIRMAEALERIQRAAGIAFPVPERWSSDDALNLVFYDELLHKGQSPYPSPSFTQPMPLEGVRRLLAQGPLPRVSMTGSRVGPRGFSAGSSRCRPRSPSRHGSCSSRTRSP